MYNDYLELKKYLMKELFKKEKKIERLEKSFDEVMAELKELKSRFIKEEKK